MRGRTLPPPTRSLLFYANSPVHLMDQMNELDRIEVIHRLGLPFKPVKGEVTGHQQKVVDSDPVQGVQDRFDLIAILIFAGEVDDGVDAHAADLQADHVGGEGRVASRIICNRKGMDELSLDRLLRKPQNLVLGLAPGPSPRYELEGIDELFLSQDSILKRILAHQHPYVIRTSNIQSFAILLTKSGDA